MSLKIYFLETRPQYLLLPVVLVILGTGMALASGVFNPIYSLLALLGLLLLHISVNTLNDYHDYRSGIDLAVNRTPFSGGSGLLPEGRISERAVLILGTVSFALAVPVGGFFLLERGLSLLPIFLLGGFFVLGYTTFLTRIGWGISEICSGLGLGTLPVIGTYYILTGEYTPAAIYASIPSGLLVLNLLLLNELPDVEADRKGGRKTLAILLGKRGAAVLYAAVSIGVYLWIVLGVVAGFLPVWTLLSCLTLPVALKAIAGGFSFDDPEKLVPALGANVAVVLLTQFLMGAGFFMAWLL